MDLNINPLFSFFLNGLLIFLLFLEVIIMDDVWNNGLCIYNGYIPCDHCGGCDTVKDDD